MCQAKWKQRCIELRTELVKQGEQASTVEAALLERLSAAEQRLGETAFKHSAEITKLKGKLKVGCLRKLHQLRGGVFSLRLAAVHSSCAWQAAQQKLKTAEDKLREAQDGFIEAEQRAEESKHRAAKLQEKLVIAEATSKSRAQAVETLSKELRTSPSPEKPKAPVQLPRSPLKVRRSRPPEVLVHSGVHLARVQRLDAFLAEVGQRNGTARQCGQFKRLVSFPAAEANQQCGSCQSGIPGDGDPGNTGEGSVI